MTVSYTSELPDELRTRVAELASDLSEFARDARDAFDLRPERWREGEEGMTVDAWIETLDDAADVLENLPEKPE